MKIPLFRKISLAAKVRLLFAAALLLILGAALFLPWDRMERLAQEQDTSEARRAATLALVQRHMELTRTESAQPATPDGRRDQPPPDNRPMEMENWWEQLQASNRPTYAPPSTALHIPPPEGDQTDPFLAQALDYFQEHPDELDVYRYVQAKPADPDKGNDAVRSLEYVRALRITSRCADCHVPEGAVRPYKANELVGVVHVKLAATASETHLFWNRFSIIGAGIVASILATVMFYVIMQALVLSPVRKLRRLADRIGEGELSVRSTIRTGDEFERLAKAFNSMLERLQHAQQDMRQINESLNSKMDELARANIALFESNKLKSEFLARVSHELRTPLNSIIGFAEVLRDQMAAEAKRDPNNPAAGKAARYADNILTSGRMLLELINDLLDLAKIEAGKMAIRVERVSVRDLVEAVVNFMRPAADKKNLSVRITLDPELPIVQTDGGKFQQVLYNLFSNAVKFTPPRGKVTVRAWRHGEGEFQLSVSDTGPGIPEEDQEAIFEKFHQLDQAATREHGGTGLGLAISRELAEMLGGRLTVDSRLGEGSTFALTIPIHMEQPGKKAVVSG